jgi:YesN/AraC family two-component response regulator
MESRSASAVSMLLVEDEEVTLKLLTSILVRKFPDASLYPATNGRSGLQLFREHKPDVVITDVNMPQMSGMQMVRKIRVLNPDAKIIVLSAGIVDRNPERASGRWPGIDHYIHKPIDFEVLFAAIEACLPKD